MSQPDHVQLHRERYYPVEDVTVTLAHTLAGRKTRVIAKRCKMHSRLWERLTDTQQTAAEYVSRCHLAIHRSPNRATDYSRRIEPAASPMPDHIDHRIRQDYKDWLKECRSLGADPIPAVRICGEGYTLRELSQSARVRVRLALHLVLGLDAMASVKGWK
jgi:hypothetical protein